LHERRPDLYFRLTLPDGETIDSRDLDGGFFPNAATTVGNAERPVELVIPRPPGGDIFGKIDTKFKQADSIQS
jgi:hypothetical protein